MATQYIYIPNLVGRQILRIPVDEPEAYHTSIILNSGKSLTICPSVTSTTIRVKSELRRDGLYQPMTPKTCGGQQASLLQAS
ncbi:hypothetical protein BU16DRAFT_617075 [Lophium mytilinum]|uniref:Uncharacterized protein n=1 Tax=Lophium mytilinum TaxID=390894 RepID=A0A6A6QZK5_9PEZI|nr:hypothetical protein BU16DRAFT_617075 [Lophium mytilinum]